MGGAGFESGSSATGTIASGQTTEVAFNNYKTTDTETTTETDDPDIPTDDPDDPSTPDNPETPTDDADTPDNPDTPTDGPKTTTNDLNTTTDDTDTTTDGSLPTTGDTTNPRLALYAAITSAVAVSAVASGFMLRRRNRYQGAHFRRI